MEDQNVLRHSSTSRLKIFKRAVWQKWSKYTISGVVFSITGLLVIIIGLVLNAASTQAALLVGGFGVIIVIIGIVRMLIGLINPAIPEDLRPLELQDEAFAEESEAVDG